MRQHFNLKNLPFEFKSFQVRFPGEELDPVLKFFEKPIELDEVNLHNPEFLNWLKSNNLTVVDQRYFESAPNAVYRLHRDSIQRENQEDHNIIKFNFIFDSLSTEMTWYIEKDSNAGQIHPNRVGSKYYPLKIFDKDKCSVIYKAQTNNHCMINGGVVHDLVNSDNNGNNRKCYSFMIHKDWQTTVDQLAEYLD